MGTLNRDVEHVDELLPFYNQDGELESSSHLWIILKNLVLQVEKMDINLEGQHEHRDNLPTPQTPFPNARSRRREARSKRREVNLGDIAHGDEIIM